MILVRTVDVENVPVWEIAVDNYDFDYDTSEPVDTVVDSDDTVEAVVEQTAGVDKNSGNLVYSGKFFAD